MTTILLINAVSSLLATVGLGSIFVVRSRRLARQVTVQTLYVTAERR